MEQHHGDNILYDYGYDIIMDILLQIIIHNMMNIHYEYNIL